MVISNHYDYHQNHYRFQRTQSRTIADLEWERPQRGLIHFFRRLVGLATFD